MLVILVPPAPVAEHGKTDEAQIPWAVWSEGTAMLMFNWFPPSHPVPSPQGALYQQHFLLLRGASPKELKLLLFSPCVSHCCCSPCGLFWSLCCSGDTPALKPWPAQSSLELPHPIFHLTVKLTSRAWNLPMNQTQWLYLAIPAPTALWGTSSGYFPSRKEAGELVPPATVQ